MDDEDTLDEPEELLEQARNAAAKNQVPDEEPAGADDETIPAKLDASSVAGLDDETIPADKDTFSPAAGLDDKTIPAGRSASSLLVGDDDDTIDVDPELIRRLREQRAEQQPTDQPPDPDQTIARGSHETLSALDEAARMRVIAHIGETAEPGPEPAGPVGLSGPESGVPTRSGRLGLLGWVLALAAVGIVALGGYTLYSRAGGQPDSGFIVFADDRDGDYEVFVMDADGSDVRQLTRNDHDDWAWGWFPDRTRIAFGSDRDGDFEVFVMDADGSDVRQLTRNDHDDWVGGWSPDGTRIAFGSDRDGDYEVFVMDADGSDVRQLTRNDHDDWVGGWSPDGTRIAFSSDRDGDFEVFVMDADGSDVRQLTRNDHDDWAWDWSPDGTRIAFGSDRDGDYDEVFVMDADGSDVRQLTRNHHNDSVLGWSPDGTRIAFTSDRDGDFEVFVMDADGSDVRQLVHAAGADAADDDDDMATDDGDDMATDDGDDMATDDGDKPTISLVVNPWTASALNVAVAQHLIESELGYPTEAINIDENEAMFIGLADGTADTVLEIWPSGITDSEQAFFDDGSVVHLGELGAVGGIGWFVPDYVIDANPELATWEGYFSDEAAAVFATAETGDNGRFLGTDPSYSQFDEQIINNLGMPFEVIYSGSEPATVAELDSRVSAGEPILMYWWTPTAAVSTYSLVQVTLPPYTEECGTSAASGDGGVDCEYPEDVIIKAVSGKLADKAPDVYDFLDAFTISNADQLSMLPPVELDGEDVDEVAAQWIADNEDVWSAWIG